jgi:cytochrome c oxidase assembly factor CtaG
VWTILTTWSFDPLVGSGLLLVAAGYLWAAALITRRFPGTPWPRRYSVAFLGGLALLWIALLGPIGSFDDVFFWAHMTQHMILMMVAAPLLLLGAPVLLILRVSPADVRRRRVLPVLHSRAVRILSDPVLTWLLFVLVLVGTHFSPFYDYALRHAWAHELIEHPLYLGAALLYYYPLVGANAAPRKLPPAARVLSLFLMMVPEAMTGFFIYASPFVMYPYYTSVARPFGPSALVDQQLGGALMWAGSMLLDTAWVALAARDWLRADARKTRRVDASTSRAAISSSGVL